MKVFATFRTYVLALFVFISINYSFGQCNFSQTFTRTLRLPNSNIESESIKQLSNRRFSVCGNVVNSSNVSSPFLSLFDSLGNTLSQRVFSFPNATAKVKTHTVTPGGGYALYGNITSSSTFTQRLFILKLDSNLNVLWSRSYSSGSFDDAKHILSLTDGSLLISGQTNIPILYKIASNGAVLWSKNFTGAGLGYIQKIVPDVSSGFILSGSISNNSASVFKIDNNANSILWQYTFTSLSLGDQIIDVVPLGNNNYVAGAYLHAFFTNGTSDMAAIRFNSSGNVAWAKVYGGSNYEFISDINPLSDGGFLLTGFSNSFAPGANILNIKISSTGNTIWSKYYGGSNRTTFLSALDRIAILSSDNFILSSTKNNFGQNNEGLIHRINCFGDNYCQSLNANTTETNFNPLFTISTLVPANVTLTVNVLNPTFPSQLIQNDTTCVSPTVPCNLTAQVLSQDTSLCVGNLINLNGSSNVPANYRWIVNGVALSNTNNFIFSQTQSGQYQVIFEASISGGCNAYDTINIQVLPPPFQPFLSPRLICAEDSILIGSSPQPGLVYSWFPQTNLTNPIASQTYFRPTSLNPQFFPVFYTLEVKDTVTGCKTNLFQQISFQPTGQPTTTLKSVSTDAVQDRDVVISVLRSSIPVDSVYLTRDSVGAAAPTFLGLIDLAANELRDFSLNTSDQIYRYYINEKLNCITISVRPFQQTILLRSFGIPSTGEISLRWNRYVNWQFGVLRYEVFIRKQGEPQFSLYTQTTDTSLIIPELVKNTTINFRIRAVRADQQAVSWSNIIELRRDAILFIPNTVTMNGDGFNDLFKIENLSLYAQNQLQILNRWGRVVFKSDNYQNNWPPSDVVAGAYYYVLDLSGPEETYKGWIEVLK